MECLDPASYQLADLDHMCFHILVTSQYFRLGGFTMFASHLRPHLKGRIREKTKTHGFANLYKPVCLVWLCVPGQPSVSQIVRLFLEGGRVLKVGLFFSFWIQRVSSYYDHAAGSRFECITCHTPSERGVAAVVRAWRHQSGFGSCREILVARLPPQGPT